jgi:hypothetical protein
LPFVSGVVSLSGGESGVYRHQIPRHQALQTTPFSLHNFTPLNRSFNLMIDHSRWKMTFPLCESGE